MIVLQQSTSARSAFIPVALMLLLWGVSALASSPAGLVNYTRGVVFAIESGKTRMIHKGDNIFPDSELVTEVGGQLSYTDYYDHRYHLAGSGHIMVEKKGGPQLKRGYLWIQSYHKDVPFSVKTANGQLTFQQGEAVIYFDSGRGKSQAVVLKGEMKFTHLVYTNLGVTLNEGEFSQVESEGLNEGEITYPRNPTRVGYNSFSKLLSLFDGAAGVGGEKIATSAKSIREKSLQERRPASQLSSRGPNTAARSKEGSSEGKIIYWRSKSVVEEIDNRTLGPNSFVHIFGSPRVKAKGERVANSKREGKRVRARQPASLVAPKRVEPTSSFERSLNRHSQKQLRHPTEVNTLINDLKSYGQDYREDY
jgi:hypothetical protein